MKKLLLIFLALYVAVNVNAQSVKLITNEQDPYTKAKVKETNFTIMCDHFGKVLSVKGRSVDGRPHLIFRIVMGSSFSIGEGDEAIVLMKNQETVRLKCLKGGSGDYSKQTHGSARWDMEAIYAIEPADLEKLTTQPVKGVRIYFGSSEYYDFDKIKEKNTVDIQEVLKAVM